MNLSGQKYLSFFLALHLTIFLLLSLLLAKGQGDEEKDKKGKELSSRKGKVAKKINRALKRGRDFLVQTQSPDGSWSGQIGCKIRSNYQGDPGPHLGVTAIVGLAFLEAGNRPGKGRGGKLLKRILKFYLSRFLHLRDYPRGFLNLSGSRMYSHGYSLLFLSRIYHLRKEAKLSAEEVEKLAKLIPRAIDLTEKSQKVRFIDSQGNFKAHQSESRKKNGQFLEIGGWRYTPWPQDMDITNTVCQLQALWEAKRAGFSVDEKVLHRGLLYILYSSPDVNPRLKYLHDGLAYQIPYLRSYSYRNLTRVTPSTTAVGSFILLQTRDWLIKRDSSLAPVIKKALSDCYSIILYPQKSYQGNLKKHFNYLYSCFYALPYLEYFWTKGAGRARAVEKWRRKLLKRLIEAQSKSGQWKNQVGAAFATAMALRTLMKLDKYYKDKEIK